MLERLDKKSLELVREAGRLAQDMGMTAYLVGGPVRDLWLKTPNLDLDMTVEGNGMRLAEAFAKARNGEVKKYPAFRTATVTLPGGRCVDFATARKETYARPGAFPAVEPSDIRDDLFRRDFTVNALAVGITPRHWNALVDPFEGGRDLKAKKVRILHTKSFVDDPTRILRAARFCARLKFSVEVKTLKALKDAVKANALQTIRPQRYLKEYNKILKEQSKESALGLLKSWGACKEESHVSNGKNQ